MYCWTSSSTISRQGSFPFLPPSVSLIFSIRSSVEMSLTLGNCFWSRSLTSAGFPAKSGRSARIALAIGVGDVEVRQLLLEVAPRRGDAAPHRLLQPLVPEPEEERGAGVLRGQPLRPEDQAQQFQADAVARPRPERPGGGVEPALPLRLGREFDQQVLDVLRQLRQPARPGPVRELEVGPEVLEHLDEVALAAAEEPADPDARLLGLVQVVEVVAEDALHALRRTARRRRSWRPRSGGSASRGRSARW